MIPTEPDSAYEPDNPYRKKKKTPANPWKTLSDSTGKPGVSPLASYLTDLGEAEQHDNPADKTDWYKPAPFSQKPSGMEAAAHTSDIGSDANRPENAPPLSLPGNIQPEPRKRPGLVPSPDQSANLPREPFRAPEPVFRSQPLASQAAGEKIAGDKPSDKTAETLPNPAAGQGHEAQATAYPGNSGETDTSSSPVKPPASPSLRLRNALVIYFNALAENAHAGTFPAENPVSPASAGKPAGNPPEQNFFTRIADMENADNLHAQRDPEGKYRYMGERLQHDISQTTAAIKRFMQYATRTAAGINRAQEETGNENHFGNWAVPVVENTLGQADPTVMNLGYQPAIMAILSHPANLAIAENLIETIETNVNGREKRELVKDAFNHEFLREFSKLGLAFSALFSQVVADTFDSTESRERSENINRMLVAVMKESDAYLARSMPFEKCIVRGDEAQTVENLTQWYYELIGSKGPYAAAAVATGGESLMAGAGLTGSTAIL